MPFHTSMDMNDKEAAYVSFKNMFKKLLISMRQVNPNLFEAPMHRLWIKNSVR